MTNGMHSSGDLHLPSHHTCTCIHTSGCDDGCRHAAIAPPPPPPPPPPSSPPPPPSSSHMHKCASINISRIIRNRAEVILRMHMRHRIYIHKHTHIVPSHIPTHIMRGRAAPPTPRAQAQQGQQVAWGRVVGVCFCLGCYFNVCYVLLCYGCHVNICSVMFRI